MKNFNRISVSKTRYSEIKSVQLANGTDISEQIIGTRRKMYVNDMLICTTSAVTSLDIGDLSQNQFNSFLGMFSRIMYKSFLTKPELFSLKIDFEGFSRRKNNKEWVKWIDNIKQNKSRWIDEINKANYIN